jgi:hypothetical protein
MTAWLPIIGALIGFAGTVVGWLLNQFGQWFGFRRERKKAMARTIYGMLQIRNRIRILPDAVQMLCERLQIPAAHQVLLVAVIDSFLVEDGFATEFEESMTVLAEYDPVLAARMRGRNQAVPLLKKLRQMIVANPMAAAFWSTIEGQIMTHALPRFDEAILEIGRLHGRRMAEDIKADLAKKEDVPEEVLTTITAAIQQQIQREQALADQLVQQQKLQPPSRERIPIWKQSAPSA